MTPETVAALLFSFGNEHDGRPSADNPRWVGNIQAIYPAAHEADSPL